MENLRTAIESDLYESIESEWKIPVELTAPDGTVQTNSKNNSDEMLGGQVLNFTQREDPITGEITVVNQPILVLRRSSLDRVPANDEKWIIKILYSEVFSHISDVVYTRTPTRANEDGFDIGFIRLYLQKIEQS